MDSAELHELRVMRGRVSALSAHRDWRAGEGAPEPELAALDAEIETLREAYRTILARQADLDHARRRQQWRAERSMARRSCAACA